MSNEIESFQVDHNRLMPGVYVSRVDRFGETVLTTYDIRVKRPNVELPLTSAAAHTIEHIGATILRRFTNAPVVYFGPMGCRTGFYMILAEEPDPLRAVALVRQVFEAVQMVEKIPGASKAECGNAADHDLTGAKGEAMKYLWEVIRWIDSEDDPHLHYPA